MSRPSSYPKELRERAVRMVADTKGDYPSEFEAIKSIAAKLGIGSAETLRKWVRRSEIDASMIGIPIWSTATSRRQCRIAYG